jgi:hypothetical protein
MPLCSSWAEVKLYCPKFTTPQSFIHLNISDMKVFGRFGGIGWTTMNEAWKGWNWNTSIKETICTSLVGETKKSCRLYYFHWERDGEKLCSTKCTLTGKLNQIHCRPWDYKASNSTETPHLKDILHIKPIQEYVSTPLWILLSKCH